MPSRDDLAEQREQSITTVCTGLVRALVVARIAALAAGGRSKDDIVGLLAVGAAFVAPGR